MTNAKKRLDVVLWAHVSASASTSQKFVTLEEIEAFMRKKGVAFTTAKDHTPMTDRAKKVCIGAAKKQYKKVLKNQGLTDSAVDKEVAALALLDIQVAPVMSNSEDYDGFDAFQNMLRKAAKGK